MRKPKDTTRACITGAQSLWAAVLLRAIDDAKGLTTGEYGTSKAAATSRACDFLLKPNRDFNFVCSLAGLDPVAVRERLIEQFAANEQAYQ